MTLPIDFVLVRHGQSEGNLAKRLAETGDSAAYDRTIVGRHTRSFRLTEKGRTQARLAGNWLRAEFGSFDRHIVSEYARAMETASLLNIPSARWYPNYYLTERDWGDCNQCSEEERLARFGGALKMRDVEPFFWRPPNGESLADLSLRLDRVFDTLHRKASEQRVIAVCHGDVMWTLRAMLERIPQSRFRELYLSNDPQNRLYNCEILHYTRRDPSCGLITPHLNWLRRIRPAESSAWDSGWMEIERHQYTNEDLAEIVDTYVAILH